MKAALAMGLLTALGGCGHMTSVQHPGNGWQVVESPNFRIFTDSRPFHYEFVAARLEHVQQAIKHAFFPDLKTPPLDVLFLSDETLFQEVADSVDLIAIFEPRAGEHGTLVIREGEEDETTAGLGVASHIVRHGIPRAPPWMHLGFASFLETTVVRNDGEAHFGQPPVGHAIEILEGRLLPLAQLEKASWTDMNGAENRRHYATAWAFIHYLAVGGSARQREDLFEMMRLAGEGSGGDIHLPITRYADSFRDYALMSFGVKPSVKVFVEQLGTLSAPALKVSPVAEAQIRTRLEAVQTARRKR